MPEDLTPPLREIADLLRQRLEQTAALAQRGEERMARIPKPELPDFAAVHAAEANARRAAEERGERRRAEDLAFRDRLLALIEQQNALLARLADRFAP